MGSLTGEWSAEEGPRYQRGDRAPLSRTCQRTADEPDSWLYMWWNTVIITGFSYFNSVLFLYNSSQIKKRTMFLYYTSRGV